MNYHLPHHLQHQNQFVAFILATLAVIIIVIQLDFY